MIYFTHDYIVLQNELFIVFAMWNDRSQETIKFTYSYIYCMLSSRLTRREPFRSLIQIFHTSPAWVIWSGVFPPKKQAAWSFQITHPENEFRFWVKISHSAAWVIQTDPCFKKLENYFTSLYHQQIYCCCNISLFILYSLLFYI